MKTQFLNAIIVCLLFNFTGKLLQSQNVFPDFADSPQWNVSQTFWLDTEIVQYTFSSDTLMCGNTYSKFDDYYDYYFRSSGKKVYMREKNNCSDPEYVVYDFGLEVGDTITLDFFDGEYKPTEIFVESIDTIEYFGIDRKALKINHNRCGGELEEFYTTSMLWIEGIGSDKHPFYPVFCYCDGCEFWSNLVCYDSSGVQLYGTPDADACDIIINVPNLISKTQKIYPNPATEQLFYEPENEDPYCYQIRSVSTNVILKDKASGSMKLNIEALSPGIYYFELFTEEGVLMVAEKFVKF